MTAHQEVRAEGPETLPVAAPPQPGAAAAADPFAVVIGRSPPLLEAVTLARRFAAGGAASVLLAGESGTGKEVFARALHAAGPHPHAPFVAIDCAALPGSLLARELFGQTSAAPGSGDGRAGLFELVREGSLFLDHLPALPLDLQALLLRALEQRSVRRVGASAGVPLRCRVIAATRLPLAELVRAGVFRQDLFYRLAAMTVELPALRRRSGDVALLARSFLEEFSLAQGHRAVRLTPAALELLERHAWPGNVRELRSAIERALAVCDGDELEARHLLLGQREPRGPTPFANTGGVIPIPPEGRSFSSVEAELLRITIALTSGNQTRAAEILGISRPTLHKKLGEYRIPLTRRRRR